MYVRKVGFLMIFQQLYTEVKLIVLFLRYCIYSSYFVGFVILFLWYVYEKLKTISFLYF